MRKFKTMGVMLDMSRNAVKSVDELKRFLPVVRKMGYNMVLFYMEDTYEVIDEPYFGYMRGRYSIAEMKEIDEFCASIGMEAVPCIQTLAHQETLSRWGEHPFDNTDIMLAGDERIYLLIDRMFKTLSSCFRTRRLHVGMDEAYLLGRGKYQDIHGARTQAEIMKDHLARVNEIAAKYGYEEPMIWSDMLFYAWNDRKYFVPRQEVPEEYKNALPENIIPVYWDYYHDQKQNFSDMLAMHQDISKKTWFAGGVWTWVGPMPDNEWTIKSMKPAIDACRDHKIDNIFMTMWGNHGNECSFWTVLPSLCYIAEYAKGNTDEEKIKAKFKRITGLDFDECMRIDYANFIAGNEQNVLHARNPSKYMLYADTLNDFLDWTVKPGASHKFAEVAADMHALAKKSRRIGYVYETAGCLCDALEIKYELGLRTRAAYEAGDKDELRRLCNEDYVKVCRLIDRYGKAMEKQWKRESKFCGFEAIDIRIGAVIRRLETVRRRLLEYCDGKIDRIEELDVAILPFREEKKSIVFGSALASMGANIYT